MVLEDITMIFKLLSFYLDVQYHEVTAPSKCNHTKHPTIYTYKIIEEQRQIRFVKVLKEFPPIGRIFASSKNIVK